MRLREVRDEDLETLYEIQAEDGWTEMAGIPRRDRETFFAHRARVAADPEVVLRVIEVDGEVVGDAVSFVLDGDRRVVGYGIARRHWGRGFASAALALLLEVVTERPLYASVLATNAGSRRVLEKCGFQPCGEEMFVLRDAG